MHPSLTGIPTTSSKPAILGGDPLCQASEFQRDLIGDQEEKAALDAIRWARTHHKAFDRYGGIEVDAYEKDFASYVGLSAATATSSGTASIHAILAALDLEPGCEVICPPITDPGGISPVLFSLAIPVFADTRSDSFNMSPKAILQAITPRTRAILVTHIAGEPCEMGKIMEIAKTHNLPVIEDVAQAHGALYRGKMCGSFGHASAFSMMGGKHHTSGGQGGMVVTDNPALLEKIKAFADRGKFWTSRGVRNQTAGLNYRMTELEAAIGRVQLRRLPDILKRRRDGALHFQKMIQGSQLFSLGWIPEGAISSYWFLRIKVHTQFSSRSKEEIVKAMAAENIPSAPTYTSIIYNQPWIQDRAIFAKSGIPWSLAPQGIEYDYTHACPNAEQALADHILISLNESVSKETLSRVALAMKRIESAYR